MSSGTVGREQCLLSTNSTWRLQPLKMGMQRNMALPEAERKAADYLRGVWGVPFKKGNLRYTYFNINNYSSRQRRTTPATSQELPMRITNCQMTTTGSAKRVNGAFGLLPKRTDSLKAERPIRRGPRGKAPPSQDIYWCLGGLLLRQCAERRVGAKRGI